METGVQQLLKNAGAVGAGQASKVCGAMNHTVELSFTNAGGSVTALEVALEGSLTGSNYVELGSHVFTAGELAAKAAIFHVVDRPVEHVRLNVKTLTQTGTTAINGHYTGTR